MVKQSVEPACSRQKGSQRELAPSGRGVARARMLMDLDLRETSGLAGRSVRHAFLLGLLLLLVGAGAGCSTCRNPTARAQMENAPAIEDPRFLQFMGDLLGAETVASNRVTELINGNRFLPAMLEAIRGAQRSITLESYIYRSGEVGGEFTEALAERARAGVDVCLLLDWLGSRGLSHRDLKRMREAGADVRLFHRHTWLSPGKLNHRDHRKFLIVDGKVGFIGGAGFADFWQGDGECPQHWRDGFYRVQGPVVASMQRMFLAQWRRVTGQVRDGAGFYPALAAAGDHPAQVFADAGGDDCDTARLMYLHAFAAARKSIRLSMAYFIPSDDLTQALVEACRRGVDVEIIVPGRYMDSKIVTPASRAKWGALLKAGVRLYRYEPSMYHCKVLIVDDVWVSVGSTNLDNRGLRINDEANLNVHSSEFAADQLRQFEDDKRRSCEVTLPQWERRSLWQRLIEVLVWPLEPLL